MTTTIPPDVIATDHDLDAQAERSSEELARHRWHQTLDPEGPRHSLRAYANAVGCNYATIRKYARGYADWMIDDSNHPLSDHIVYANVTAEKAEVAEAVAEVEGIKPSTVAGRRGVGDSLANVTELARERAERTGTTIGQAAREITERKVAGRRAEANRETGRKAQHTLRYIAIEGHLAGAKRRLTDALNDAQDIGFSDEELELLRDAIAQIRALLNLIDMRLAGNPDVDWDDELARLGGVS
jgi:hypothetical protein